MKPGCAQPCATSRPERDRVRTGALARGVAVAPTLANFVFFDGGMSSTDMAKALLKDGIIVKPWLEFGYGRLVRASIGTPAENDRLIASVERLVQRAGLRAGARQLAVELDDVEVCGGCSGELYHPGLALAFAFRAGVRLGRPLWPSISAQSSSRSSTDVSPARHVTPPERQKTRRDIARRHRVTRSAKRLPALAGSRDGPRLHAGSSHSDPRSGRRSARPSSASHHRTYAGSEAGTELLRHLVSHLGPMCSVMPATADHAQRACDAMKLRERPIARHRGAG